MIDLDAAFYDRMASDATLTALLETYPDATVSSGAVPTIFTDDEVPEDAPRPYVHSYGQIVNVPDDIKMQQGRDILRDILVVADRNQTALVEEIAQRIVTLFHRHALAITGALTIVATASGPIPGESDHTLTTRIVSVRLRFELN